MIRRGFTLVELMVVIVLLSLVSATAAVMVRPPLAKARRQQAISQLQFLDSIARERSQGGQRLRLVFDVKERRARLLDGKNNELASPLLLQGDQEFLGLRGTENPTRSRRVVRFDRFGTSRSYAVKVGSDSRQNEWLLVLGMTGQSYVVTDQGVIDAIIDRERDNAR